MMLAMPGGILPPIFPPLISAAVAPHHAAVPRHPHEVDVLPLGEPLDDGHGGCDAGAGAHEHHIVVVDGPLHQAGLGGADPERQAGLAETEAEELLRPVAHLENKKYSLRRPVGEIKLQ